MGKYNMALRSRKFVDATGKQQLRWVVLLLAIAVILPTVCLLWFMSRAVRNERLAVKQKLTDVYMQRLETLSKGIDDLWSARIETLGQQATAEHQPVEIFERLVGREEETNGSRICDAIIIFDDKGRLLYPVTGDGKQQAELSDEFTEAWGVEFTEGNFPRAIKLYERISESFVDDYTRYSALMGKIRCLRKLANIEQAIVLCEKIAYGQFPEDVSSSSAALIARARILLVDLKSETKEGLARSDLQNLINSTISYAPGGGYAFLPMPSGTRVFLLRKAIEIVEKSQWAEELEPQILRAKELLSAEELAVAVLDKYYTAAASELWSEEDAVKMVTLLRTTLETIQELDWNWTEQLQRQISIVLDSYRARTATTATFDRPVFTTTFGSWPEDNLRKLDLPQDVFGIYHSIGDKIYMLLQNTERFNFDFKVCGDALKESGVSYRITDNFGAYACGLENPEKAAFLRVPLGKFFPGWHVEIHFKDFDVFERTAGRQTVIYMWAGLLAIAVMFAAGLLAAQTVGRQIKINRLKNDFIATVSHELKTPLASMRVLVDTLLEGNYKDQQQVTEYLQLVSKENERLSSLVDNFLTFSRMERNKQAFEMLRAHPAAIARDASEAVKTKLSVGRCKFEVNIQEDLPEVLADRDAMVTVLVNLLDNAYKYSYDDKHIKLSVSAEDGSVCFRVSDNGIGMSRRAIRRIFNRFYQVDRSLTRRAEGCGLGLSIAKFIVDAHKGSISVESKTGHGSTFTIRLSAVKPDSG
jgi:signal transduction histidine kinase/tetratricopeptide (TPR) repeat protein